MKRTDLSDLGISIERSEITERFKQEREKLTKAEWKKIKKNSGLSASQISNVFGKEKTPPSMEFIIRLSRAFRKPIEYFLYGKRDLDDHIIKVPHIETYLSDKNTLIFKENYYCYLNPKCIEKRIKNIYDLVCMQKEGDSMQPTIMKDNYIMIDRSIKKIKDGNIYAFSYENIKNIQVKRLSFWHNKICIIPDNKRYESYSADLERLNIIGLVIFIFQIII